MSYKLCHTLRGCVDWNAFGSEETAGNVCHTLRGCVDWNKGYRRQHARICVTPFVGVWIETSRWSLRDNAWRVTPFVGVWIETSSESLLTCSAKSHPSWVCGLKHILLREVTIAERHTLRGCVDWNLWFVASQFVHGCHTLRGCVDWNCKETDASTERVGHTLRGCVDWNPLLAYHKICNDRHTLRGCVDWNKPIGTADSSPYVTPFVGVWIETPWDAKKRRATKSHPSWVCGLKPTFAYL